MVILSDLSFDSGYGMRFSSSKLLERVELTNGQIDALKNLQDYDLSFITERLVDDINLPLEAPEQVAYLRQLFDRVDFSLAKNIELEFRKWFSLVIIYPHEDFVPSRPVDMYWHYLVLHTMEYSHFCKAVFGRFIHHVGAREAGMDYIQNRKDETLSRLVKLYGPLDQEIWGTKANPGCSNYSFFDSSKQ